MRPRRSNAHQRIGLLDADALTQHQRVLSRGDNDAVAKRDPLADIRTQVLSRLAAALLMDEFAKSHSY